MFRNPSITFKEKISSDIPLFNKRLKDKYDDLGIFEIGIPSHMRKELRELIELDVQWIQLLLIERVPHTSIYKFAIERLETWIDNWKKAEISAAGSNIKLLEDLEKIYKEARIIMLAIMIWSKPRGVQENMLNDFQTIKIGEDKFLRFARNLYELSRDRNFDSMVLLGKRDYFKSNCWPPGASSITSDEFFVLFENEIKLFLSNGVNEIYLKEIRKHLNIGQIVNFTDIERIYNYFFGSYETFIKFLNRNYQYIIIQQGLVNLGLHYHLLQSSINSNLLEKQLILTASPFKKLLKKVSKIGLKGLEGSPRFCEDKLVIFGKDSNDEFTADFSLPNISGIDSIFAFIFINHSGYYLVDISKSATIRIKINPGTEFELKNEMIIVFGKAHAYIVRISNPVLVSERNFTNLQLEPYSKATSQHGRNLSSNDRVSIGRDPNSNLFFEDKYISQRHAECYFDMNTSKWILKDLGSENGTFYKLKTLQQCLNMEASEALKIEGNFIFCIQSFTFLIRDYQEIMNK